LVDKTLLYIKISHSTENDILPHLQQDVVGYNTHQVYQSDEPHHKKMRVVYNRKLGYFEIRGLKKSIRMYDGTVLQIIRLSDKPIITKQTRRRLIRAALVFAGTYVSGFTSMKVFSTLLLEQTLMLSLIPSIVAFLMKLADDTKIDS
jgi:hypothetical protein